MRIFREFEIQNFVKRKLHERCSAQLPMKTLPRWYL